MRFVNNGGNSFVEQNGATNSASRPSGGIILGMGDGSVRTIRRISLPDSGLEYSFVDADDPNAESKVRALLDAADRMQSGIVIAVAREASSVLGRFLAAEFFINDGGDANVLAIELQNVIVSSYQVSGGGTTATAALSLSFTKIEDKTVPSK